MEVKYILENNLLGVLATVNSDGSPWAIPLHIFSDDNNVYWFSSEKSQHSANIENDPRVSVSLFSPDKSLGLSGIYVNGSARKLNKSDSDLVRKIVQERLGQVPPNFVDATAYRLPLGELDELKTRGNCWYFYSENN